MKKPKFIELKVYKNKRTGQSTIILPKGKNKKIPDSIEGSSWMGEEEFQDKPKDWLGF